jgi:hypothetical protein
MLSLWEDDRRVKEAPWLLGFGGVKEKRGRVGLPTCWPLSDETFPKTIFKNRKEKRELQ